MAIFARRVLQRLIDENSKVLNREQTLKLVKALNRADEHSLGFEWEVVLINVLSKFGKVEYEPDLGGTSRPDIKFESGYKDKFSFVADIATVSDRGIEEYNPSWDFNRELMRLANKYKLKLNCFFVGIRGEDEGESYDRKIKLKIPSKGNFGEFFNNDFKAFLKEISGNPGVSRSFIPKTASIGVSVTYNPAQSASIMHLPAYTIPYSLTRNPLYRVLNEKAKQLKKANYNGVMAIFLCDGGCNSLNNDGHARNSYATKQIIDNFFRRHPSISFVLTFTIKKEQYVYSRRNPRGTILLYENSAAEHKIDFQSTFLAKELRKFLPDPVNDANYVVSNLTHPSRKVGLSFNGGVQMTEKTIRFSSRALLMFLAGETDQKKFFDENHLFDSLLCSPGKNFFAQQLNEGKLIKSIKLQKTNEDDDWIEIEFGIPDPAISKFAVPE
jgi:hypothetical protein